MLHETPITDWLAEWGALWGARELGSRTRIEPGRRLRRSLGRCQPTLGMVRIHPALFGPEHAELFREVVCHEAAHVAVHLLHGRRNVRPHGVEWKRLVAAAGYAPNARMDPARLPSEMRESMKDKVLYRHQCLVCGMARMARRRVKNWRCRRCYDAGLKGTLEILRVERTAVRA